MGKVYRFSDQLLNIHLIEYEMSLSASNGQIWTMTSVTHYLLMTKAKSSKWIIWKQVEQVVLLNWCP